MRGGFMARIIAYANWRTLRRIFTVQRGSRAYTIIEVLIVLAVTGGLFVGAALLIAGRRQQTEFNQSIRQVVSQIQQVINDVATGYYPETNNFQCSAGPSGPILTAGSTEQGTNSGCIFMGKAIQFDIAATNPEQFAIYSIAGLQKNAAGQEVKNRVEAQPKLVTPSTSQPTIPDASINENLLGGLTATRMWYNDGVWDIPTGSVAFMTALAVYDGSAITSGGPRMRVIPVHSTTLGMTKPAFAESFSTNFPISSFDVTGGVFICFRSGGTNQSGLVSIADNGRQLSVTLDIKSNLDCS